MKRALGLVLLLAACADGTPTSVSPPGSVPPLQSVVARSMADGLPVQGAWGPAQAADLVPLPTRPRKRMNIDQLAAALQQATGEAWVQPAAGKAVDQFQALAATLGKPDYSDATQEDLTPSALFQKFLLDAALHTCGQLMTHDPPRKPAQRLFFVHAEPTQGLPTDAVAVDANLRYLLLRFHGRPVLKDAEELQSWRWLLQASAKAGGGPPIGWHAVCVGLVTHPRFTTY